jgi:hypothetical protein
MSDEAIREAYFLGQRHDGSFSGSLDCHATESLPSDSVTIRVTPF